MKRISFFIRIN